MGGCVAFTWRTCSIW